MLPRQLLKFVDKRVEAVILGIDIPLQSGMTIFKLLSTDACSAPNAQFNHWH